MTDKIEIQKSIDWLTATFDYEYNPTMQTSKYDWTLPIGKGWNEKGVTRPTRYYKRAKELECGGTLEFSDDSVGKPHAKLNLTGENLRWLRNHSQRYTDESVIRFIAMTAKNTTRIDFAIDIIGGGNTYQFLHSLQSGYATARGKISHIDAITGQRGHTVYIGSKDSHLRMRVYDKAAEVGLLDEIWTRIELQARKDYAKALVSDMMEHGVNIGGTNRINKMVNAKNLEWWNLAVDSEGKPSSGYDDTNNNWRRWIKETVIPSLLSHAQSDPDVIAQVFMALQSQYLDS